MAKQAKPKAAAQLQARAASLFDSGRVDEADALFRAMLADNKNDPYAIYHVALILHARKNHVEGLPLTERGVALVPRMAPMWYLRAALLQALGRNDTALQSYDKALALQPDFIDALINSGVLLRGMFDRAAALARFEQALRLQPRNEKALINCATLLSQQDDAQASIELFARLVAVNPDYPYALGLLSHERLRSCDWTDFDALTSAIVQGVRQGKRVCKSIGVMAISGSAADHFQCARTFAQDKYPKAAQALWNGERYQHDRVRIAYVSPDFREHPVTHLMAGIFERHDRSRFETIAISTGVDDKSAHRARLVESFDRFIDVAGQGDLQIAQQIRALEIDVLIDLAGYTADSRIEVFAHRPAPVQVTYLGYPGTLGTDYFDHILADRHVIPPEHQAFYAEKVAYLPDTYLPTDAGIRISERTPTREECGLPPEGVVLCSFSHDFKIHPAMFAVWMRLLAQIPGSVLWLSSRAGLSQSHLRAAAEAHGIDPVRLVFAARLPKVEDHLARYRLADVFLDTSPYNAHTTAADALMAGLPVVTFMGDAFPARVAGSLLHAIGLPELIADSLQGYEALVLKLIADPALLADTKARLLANRHTHPLFDTDRFCRKLEDTLMRLHRQHDAPEELPAVAAAPAVTVPTPEPAVRRLHIGGQVRKEGWEVLNALPGEHVDHLGNANDLSRFADGTFDAVYASHVVEHLDYRDELQRTLAEWCRVLKPGGIVQVSVPDLEVLAGLLLDKQLAVADRFMVMRMMFGGHIDAYDYHQVGLTAEFLAGFLAGAGFVAMQRVEGFGHFSDTSDMVFAGKRISLNVQARKPL